MSHIDSPRRRWTLRAALAAAACIALVAPVLSNSAASAVTAQPTGAGSFWSTFTGTYLANHPMPRPSGPAVPITGLPAEVLTQAQQNAGYSDMQPDLYFRNAGSHTLNVRHGCTQANDAACGRVDDLHIAIASSPSAARIDGNSYVFYRQNDGQLGLYETSSSGWSFGPLGGAFVGDPITVVRAREIDTFVVNSQGQLWDYVVYGTVDQGWRFVKNLGANAVQFNISASVLPNGHVAFALRTAAQGMNTIQTWSMLAPADQQTDSSDFSFSHTGTFRMDSNAPVLITDYLSYFDGVSTWRLVPVNDLSRLI